MILACEAQFIAPQSANWRRGFFTNTIFFRHVLKKVDSFRIVKPTNVSKPLRQLADWGAKTVTQPKNPNHINTKPLIYTVLI